MYGDVYTSNFKPPEELVSHVQTLAKTTKTGLKYVDIPFVKATEDSLDGYGKIVQNFELRHVHIIQWPSPGNRGVSGGCDGGVSIGEFHSLWEKDHCYVKNGAVGGKYHNGWREGNDIFFQDANYHPDGEQIFWPKEKKPFIMILSDYSDDLSVTPLDFVAFYFDGTFGFAVKPGVYHLAVFPMANSKASLISKQGKVHGVVLTDFLKEFGVYGRIPDALKKIPATDQPKPVSIPSDIRNDHSKTENNKIPFCPHSLDRSTTKILKPLTPTSDNFEDYGTVLTMGTIPEPEIFCLAWPQKERQVYLGNEAGIRSINYTMEWDQSLDKEPNDLIIHRTNCKFTEAGCICHAHTYHVDKLKSRIDGETLLHSLEQGSYMLLLAKSHSDGEPKFESFRAFLLNENHAVRLKPSTWFAHPIPANGSKKIAFEEKFCAVNARLEISLGKESKSLIKITSSH